MGPSPHTKNRFKNANFCHFSPFFEKNGSKAAFGVGDPPIFARFSRFLGGPRGSRAPGPPSGGVPGRPSTPARFQKSTPGGPRISKISLRGCKKSLAVRPHLFTVVEFPSVSIERCLLYKHLQRFYSTGIFYSYPNRVDCWG